MKRFVLLALLLVAVGAGYWYYTLTTGPKYALAQAYRSVQKHDVASFEKYVDVESVTGNLVDQVMQPEGMLGAISQGGPLMRGVLGMAKPQLARAVRQEVRRYVETGSLDTGARGQPASMIGVSIAGMASKVVTRESSFKGIKYVQDRGENALVGLEFTQPKFDTTLVLEVMMRDQGDYWQVKEITNMGELMKHVARLEKEQLLGRSRSR